MKNDLGNFPPPIAISVKYINKLCISLKDIQGTNLSEIKADSFDENFTENFKIVINHLKKIYSNSEYDFIKKLICISQKITDIVSKIGNEFEEEVSKRFTEDEADCARYFFVSRCSEYCYQTFKTFRMGVFDILEESVQRYITSNFSHGYCFDIMWQMISLMVKTDPAANEKLN